MRASLSFLTTTSSTGDNHAEAPAPMALDLVGYDRVGHRVLARERVGDRVTSTVVIATRGEHAGVAMALAPDALARLDVDLAALTPIASAPFDLTTRVMQRRGLVLGDGQPPIRKFALALGLKHTVGGVAIGSGRQVVVAYLRPRATLRQVWALPGGVGAVAIVSYCGSPLGVGADREAAVLVQPALH